MKTNRGMGRTIQVLMAVGALAFSSGCASIVSKSEWPVTINSEPSGATVVVKNANGVELKKVTTPATVRLKSGAGYFRPAEYTFEFQKEGCETRSASLSARLNEWYFGNILFGGLIGLGIVDPATGAMWKLDHVVTANLAGDLEPATSVAHAGQKAEGAAP